MPELRQYEPTPYPRDKQFVVIWEYNGRPWSTTYRFMSDKLHSYDSFKDVWVHDTLPLSDYQVFVIED